MRTELRGLGGVLTGDLAAPTSGASVIAFEDGRITTIGQTAGEAETIVEAGGAWAMPGHWDGAASLYFGDHEPQFSARGAIAAAVEFGTTSLVGNGTVRVPGWIGDPRSARELAVLTVKSWRFDRPRGIKVLPGVVDADPAWTAEDFADLSSVGVSTVLIPGSTSDSAATSLAAAVRESGLRIGVSMGIEKSGGLSLEDVVAIGPDVVRTTGLHTNAVRELLAETNANLGVTLAGGLRAATDAVCSVADRGQLGRIFLGSGLPGRSAVLPAGIALFVDALAATTGLGREQLIALASSNVARAFGVDGGTLAIGQPADVVLVDADQLDGAGSWATPVRATFIDGNPAWSREATA
jgi:hypothetical protein